MEPTPSQECKLKICLERLHLILQEANDLNQEYDEQMDQLVASAQQLQEKNLELYKMNKVLRSNLEKHLEVERFLEEKLNFIKTNFSAKKQQQELEHPTSQ